MIALKHPTSLPDSLRTVKLRIPQGTDALLTLDINQPTQRYIYETLVVGGLYEVESTVALVMNLRPGDTFFDVGANCGWFSAIALGLGANVVAIEPSQRNIEALRKNAPEAHIIEGVATDREGMANLFINLDNDGGHCLWECGKHPHNIATGAASNPTQAVRAYTLDSLSGYAPNVIKIDTEGAECNVLLGAERILSNPALRMVICERHLMGLDLMGHTPEEVLAIMDRHGFTTEQVPEDHFDNWIFKR
jgi:FkbM family methyltransferase